MHRSEPASTAATTNRQQRRGHSPGEAAAIIGVSRGTVYQLMAEGRLRSIKVGSRRIIPSDSIDELLAASA